MLSNYRAILWDFDGVIMDSMPTRSRGFELALQDYPPEQVAKLMQFHLENGGLSRYVKFRYFFETIRSEFVSEQTITDLATSFSKIMLSALIDPNLFIEDSMQFIQNNWNQYEMHIVSGSDGNELRTICRELDIAKYFKSINGSPTPKTVLVNELLAFHNYSNREVVLIGDSKNDFEASMSNSIDFFGYNNPELKNLSSRYINSFLG